MVFVAAGIVGFVPDAAAQVVSIVVQVVAGTARELQSRHRGNTFLDKVNQDLFMPRGLYAMVMCFKDQVPGQQKGLLANLSNSLGKTLFASKKLDLNETIAKYSNPDPNMSTMNKQLKNIRLASGKTYGQVELPESAELVFPDLDRVAAQELGMKSNEKRPENSGVREKFKDAGVWVQDYMDRRAQVFYVRSTPFYLYYLISFLHIYRKKNTRAHPLLSQPTKGRACNHDTTTPTTPSTTVLSFHSSPAE